MISGVVTVSRLWFFEVVLGGFCALTCAFRLQALAAPTSDEGGPATPRTPPALEWRRQFSDHPPLRLSFSQMKSLPRTRVDRAALFSVQFRHDHCKPSSAHL